MTSPTAQTTTSAILVQTGTIAGTVTVGFNLMTGKTDVTLSSARALKIEVPASVPRVTSVSATQSGPTLVVITRGFSDTRELTRPSFHVTPLPGDSLNTEDVTIAVGPIFATWYADPASRQYGSEFTYSQILNLTSDTSVVGKVADTLTNSVGG